MGVFKCEKHDMRGLQHGCSHFIDAVDNDSPLEVEIRWSFWSVPFLLCRDCQISVDIARKTSDPEIRSDTGLDLPDAQCFGHVLDWCSNMGTQNSLKLLTWMTSRASDDSG